MPTLFADQITKELLFFYIFMIVIFSWILISLWGKWLDNFTFVTLGLDEKSPSHTFIVALAVTLILIACIIFLRTFGVDYSKLVVGETNNLQDYTIYDNPNFFDESRLYGDIQSNTSSYTRLSPITRLDAVNMFNLV